jgi:hypothetical protein
MFVVLVARAYEYSNTYIIVVSLLLLDVSISKPKH